jgi:hypothetical protein
MAREQENKAVVGRWFSEFWGSPWNPAIIDELTTPDMLLQYSLHAPRRGVSIRGGPPGRGRILGIGSGR